MAASAGNCAEEWSNLAGMDKLRAMETFVRIVDRGSLGMHILDLSGRARRIAFPAGN